MSAPSRMVPDDFEFEKTLGTGAFSKVLVARYIPTDAKYAVKLIPKRQILNAPSDEERMRMAEVARREMRMLLMCNHPNIIRFYASMQTPDDLMYVTELCNGGELLNAIRQRGKIPLEAARHVLAELFSAVWYLHHGAKKSFPIVPDAPLKPITILHRDIKPENIMLGEQKHVKLIDFGTAIVCETVDDHPNGEGTGKGRARTFCGTTHYMSPELLQDNYTCIASDYWACGCVLFHMLTGRRPFDAATQYLLIKAILEQEPEYPAGMDPQAKDLISRLLVKDPARRLTMDDVKQHAFFSSISFDTLEDMDMQPFWVKDAVWAKDDSANACAQCEKPFGMLRRKHHCRQCGNIFCSDCTSRRCIIPESTYTSPERVCDACFTHLQS